MESNIKGYPNYYWDGNDVWNISKNKVIKQTKVKDGTCLFVKMKDYCGKWKGVKVNTVKSLTGFSNIPKDFCEVPYTNSRVFINEDGVIYSNQLQRIGVKLSPYVGYDKNGNVKYPVVTIKFKGKSRIIGVHQLMCITFHDKDYLDKGLVCMHKDNDKLNYKLSNLKVGTYSENNKQAYDDGINQGNITGYSGR